jgi:hypothetical protein
VKEAGLIFVLITFLIVLTGGPAAATLLLFSERLPAATPVGESVDDDHVEIAGLDYPVRRIRLAHRGYVGNIRISASAADSADITDTYRFNASAAGDIPTSALPLNPDGLAQQVIALEGRPACAVAGITRIGDVSIIDVVIATVMQDSSNGTTWLATEFALEVDVDPIDTFSTVDDGCSDRLMNMALARNAISLETGELVHYPVSPDLSDPAGDESIEGYVIITADSLVDEFEPLSRWKMQLGYASSIVTTQQILAEYPGADSQEKIRNFLIDSYSNGTRWVLLGGDETIIPVRYACHVDRSAPLTLDYQQICDLYYGDIDGIWDVDGDGIFGEPTHDSPDRTPELMIGRALVSTAEQARAFAEKTVRYELDPAPADSSFTSNVLIASSDQMRDYMQVGQAEMIAQRLPADLEIDIETLAEAPTGVDGTPSSPSGSAFIDALSAGANLTFVLCHGAVDGFVTQASYYNQWPKSFVFTRNEAPVGHGTINDLSNSGRYGIVYSIGCSNGAFDMDSPPFENTYPCVAEKFISDSARGAAAFIGYSRWGWVASSYRLAIDFNEYLFGFDNRLAPANNYSKLNNPSYVDLAYGLNVYGDPALRVWTSMPQELSLSTPDMVSFGHNEFEVFASSGSAPIEGATVTVVSADSLLAIATTDASGTALVEFDLDSDSSVVVTVSKNGYKPAFIRLGLTIALDSDDDVIEETLPVPFIVAQNYPNPFNPTTEIQFTCGIASDVSLEVFNVLGQLTLKSTYAQVPAGTHSFAVDATSWPSGIYFYRITASDWSEIRKMALVK